MKLPFIGKLSKNQQFLLYAGLGGLGLLAFLAYTGKKSGFGPLDAASQQFGSLTGPLGFPTGKGASMIKYQTNTIPYMEGDIPLMKTPPVSSKMPTVADASGMLLVPSGMGANRLVNNQGISLAPDTYPPAEYQFSGSYFGDYNERDLITVA